MNSMETAFHGAMEPTQRKERQVEQQIRHQEESIAKLDAILAELGVQLHPVLLPEPHNQAGTGEPEIEGLVPLAARIHANTRKIHHLQKTVLALIEQLQI